MLLFAIGAVFKIPQANSEMCAAMQRAGRRAALQVQKVQKVQEVSEVSEDSWPVEYLLKVRKVTFSSDSSRKWLSQWLVGENLDRSWQGALLC